MTTPSTAAWADLAAARGMTVRKLMFATGLSDEAVRRCLRDERLPRNPVVADIFAKAIGLPADQPSVVQG